MRGDLKELAYHQGKDHSIYRYSNSKLDRVAGRKRPKVENPCQP